MRARKRFAQHFLEPAWVRKVAAAVAPRPHDALIEIGPGQGALTMALAEAGPTMTLVELDRDLAAALRPRLPSHVELVEADVLDVDLRLCAIDTLARRSARFGEQAAGWPATVRVAGNLPYNISTPLLVARPGCGDYGPLSVLAQMWSDAEIVLRVPAGAFRPPPKVQSAVVTLRFRPARAPVADLERFDRVVRAVFLQRRKMLSNALQPVAESAGTSAGAALARANLDGRRRPETLSLEELARLVEAVDGVAGQ